MSTKKSTSAAADDPAVTPQTLNELRGRKQAVERELTQLASDGNAAIEARIRHRFKAHETAKLESELEAINKDIATAEKALAKQKPATTAASTSDPLSSL